MNKHIISAVSYDCEPNRAMDELLSQLGSVKFAFFLLFCSPNHNAAHLCSLFRTKFTDVPLFGCTSAGELTDQGMVEGTVLVLGFPANDFGVRSCYFPDLHDFSLREGEVIIQEETRKFRANRHADKPHSFAITLIDGLSYKEEHMVWAAHYALEDIPLVGGSAADGEKFQKTKIFYNSTVATNAGTLLLVESRYPVRVFKTDSLIQTPIKMVVTKADPAKRIVYELNAMPAAQAFADAIGVSRSELDISNFAAHPLTVRIGDKSYVRSIGNVFSDDSFGFYSSIEEGMVFTLAEVGDMVQGLEETLDQIVTDMGVPQLILGFDCVLRKVMYEHNQTKKPMSELYKKHNVIGFNTYGEQLNTMHLNQTFTGIAFGQ